MTAGKKKKKKILFWNCPVNREKKNPKNYRCGVPATRRFLRIRFWFSGAHEHAGGQVSRVRSSHPVSEPDFPDFTIIPTRNRFFFLFLISLRLGVVRRNGVPLSTVSKTALDDGAEQIYVQKARWSPSGSGLAFVYENDLYYKIHGNRHSRIIRITDTGSSTVFNGIPDWLYQGEPRTTDGTRGFFFFYRRNVSCETR